MGIPYERYQINHSHRSPGVIITTNVWVVVAGFGGKEGGGG